MTEFLGDDLDTTSSYWNNPSASSGMNAGIMLAGLGGVLGMYGAFSAAQSQKQNLQFQSDMAALNARAAERTAQSILAAGEKEISQVTAKYGQIEGQQKASQAARGIVMGEGSAAEEIASTEMAKEEDKYTINANAVRAAMAARTQGVNMQNESLLAKTMAKNINPFISTMPSMINAATSVSGEWYKYNKRNRTIGE